jgi:hypothetical protein
MRGTAKVNKAEKVLTEMSENFSQFLPPTEHLGYGTPLPWHRYASIPGKRKVKEASQKSSDKQ